MEEGFKKKLAEFTKTSIKTSKSGNKRKGETIMIQVKAIAKTNADPMVLASHAALMCYQSDSPKMGELIDVKGRLFNPGHHTTLEHSHITFQIDGIPVNDITFGEHLTHPFSNSDQKSGRFCATMFLNPDYKKMEEHIRFFWPELSDVQVGSVMSFIRKGVTIYHENIKRATELTAEAIRKERPNAKPKYVAEQSAKIAQEQLRNFISTIFPTGFDKTENLITIAAEYEGAWSPGTRYTSQKKVEAALKAYPMSMKSKMINYIILNFPNLAKKLKLRKRQDISFMFNPEKQRKTDWVCQLQPGAKPSIRYTPDLQLIAIEGDITKVVQIKAKAKDPVDKLHFMPELMENSVINIRTKKRVSVATYGQDQRHRTLRRSTPYFTGEIYLPPIVRMLGLEFQAEGLMLHWFDLAKNVPASLWMALAPYGAMVEYESVGPINAIIHEQGKRTCWCAQEEIYWLAVLLRKEIASLIEQIMNMKAEQIAREREERLLKAYQTLISIFEPACYSTGVCIEGVRSCGRDMKLRTCGDYFPKRQI